MLVFSCWGGFGFTPIAYNWYNLIEATIPVSFSLSHTPSTPFPFHSLATSAEVFRVCRTSAGGRSGKWRWIRSRALATPARGMRCAVLTHEYQILFPPAITSLTFLCLTVVEGMLSGIRYLSLLRAHSAMSGADFSNRASWTVNGGLKSSGITPPAFSTL